MMFLFVTSVLVSVWLKSPFYLSILLLFLSVVFSVLISFKTVSLWVTAVILLTFSSGMMVMFSYASSLVSLGFKIKLKSFVYITLVFFSIFFVFYCSEVNFSMENSMKEFSSMDMLLLVVVVLAFFMVPMMENCFNPNNPIQSCF